MTDNYLRVIYMRKRYFKKVMIECDVAIVGAGVAGLTAAIYSSRRELKTIVFEDAIPGGQLNFTATIENYPGFPEGIIGADLAGKVKTQAAKYGAEIKLAGVSEITQKGDKFIIKADKEYISKAVILATGTKRRELDVPGEEELKNRGVSYCATCDGPLFKGKKVTIIGGSDAAVESALMMTKIASSVCLIHRRDKLRAEEILQKRLFASDVKIVWDSKVVEIKGDKFVSGIVIKNKKTGKESEMKTEGVLVEIGNLPRNDVAKKLGVEVAKSGYIKAGTDGSTNIKGVYAAGDVTGQELQLGVAVSDGIIASKSAYKYICTECA